MPYFLLTMWALFAVSAANYPVFEGASQLKRLLIPADVHIGSVIYRLRASDHDHEYPLQFDATGKFAEHYRNYRVLSKLSRPY